MALSIYLFLVACVWLWRAFWLSRLRSHNPPIVKVSRLASPDQPLVSLIVPARNEEKNIARCLRSLFQQTYKNIEIVVVNDRSTDQTPHLLDNFKKLSPFPFKIVTIEKLPPGWTGKNHGMYAASKIAAGEWMLFTDADTTHKPECVASSLQMAISKNIDFLTLAPETESHTFWEKTVQPLAVGSLALWFQSEKVNDTKNNFVLANGQFILVKKEVYEKVGGNESVKSEVVEDVELAKKVRAAGFTMKFLNGTELYSTRMYSSLKEIKTGWTRIFTYLFNKNPWAVIEKILLFVFISLGPFFIFTREAYQMLGGSSDYQVQVLWSSAALCALIIAIRWVGNRMVKSDEKYALLHPLGSLIMIWILSICLMRILFKLPSVWRGDLHK